MDGIAIQVSSISELGQEIDRLYRAGAEDFVLHRLIDELVRDAAALKRQFDQTTYGRPAA